MLCRVQISYRRVQDEKTVMLGDARGEAIMMVVNPKSEIRASQTKVKVNTEPADWDDVGNAAVEMLDHLVKTKLGFGGTVEDDIRFLSANETITNDTAKFVFYLES